VSERQWYFIENGNRNGPVAEDALRSIVQAGRIKSDTLVWSEGMQDWQPMSDSPVASLLMASAKESFARVPVPPFLTADGVPGVGGPGRPMGFFEAIASCFGKYVQFSGRASRSEYWYFVLFCFLIGLVAQTVGLSAGGTEGQAQLIPSLVSLATFLPSLSVFVRRLHDTDRSGWWWWLWLVPVIGWIVLIVFLCERPTPGRNRFG
jgi:uncharacterized membrane protein YhaH (DUF805 family)